MRFSILLSAIGLLSLPASIHPALAHDTSGLTAHMMTKHPKDMKDMASAPITPPTLTSTDINPVTTPYPDPHLAPVQVKEAFATALRTHRKILLDFGGNWCPDCRILAGVFAVPEAAAWLEKHFVVVPVNVEHFKINTDIARNYGAEITAVPTILILTPQGKLLNPEGLLALGNARTMSPQAVLDLLAQWANRQ